MPPKRKTGAARNVGSDTDTDAEMNTGESTSPNIVMSENMLQTLVASITRSQAEANHALIQSIMAGNKPSPSPSPCPETPSPAQRSGNFAKCTARFDGRCKDADELEAFVDAVEVYRECTNVSDEHALRGLPMLLVGDAAVWWQGVKSSVTSWSDALQRLRGMFGAPRPGYKIFRDIFSSEQNNERADVFVSRVRASLSKLPYVVPEEMKLDIVYGLLDRRIRKRVPRDAVDGLEQLISKVRLVEESLAEVSSHIISDNSDNARPVNPFDGRGRRLNAVPGVNPLIATGDFPTSNKCDNNTFSDPRDTILSNKPRVSNTKSSDSEGQKRVRPKCSYCKLFGHTIGDCRKKVNKTTDIAHEPGSSSQLRCYGCGQLGVVRSKCDNCKSGPSTSKTDFCTANIVDNEDPRPMVEIEIVNRTGVAILDTGATHSIAGPMLYDLLVDAGVVFKETVRTIGLADGSQQVRTTLQCNVSVGLHGRTIPTTFMILPDAKTRTLLGRDFITQSNILLDLPQSSWRFNDEPNGWHPFITSFELPTGSRVDLMKLEAAGLHLRSGKGTRLTQDQKMDLMGVQTAGLVLKDEDERCHLGATLSELPSRSPKDICMNRLKDPNALCSGVRKDHVPLRGRGRTDDDGNVHQMASRRERDKVLAIEHNAHLPARPAAMNSAVFSKDGCALAYPALRRRGRATAYTSFHDSVKLGRRHVSQLTPSVGDVAPPSVNEKRKRGRPKRYLD